MPTPKPIPEAIAGFASLPHSLCADLDLTDNAYRILGALMRFAHDQTTCFPSNAKLGAAAGGKSAGTVVRGLRELEDRGLIRRVINPDSQHRDGIELTWDRIATPSISEGGPPPNLDRTPSKNGVPPSKFDMAPPPNLEGLYEEESGEEVFPSPGADEPLRSQPTRKAEDFAEVMEAARILAGNLATEHVGQRLIRSHDLPDLLPLEGWRFVLAANRLLSSKVLPSNRGKFNYFAGIARNVTEAERDEIDRPPARLRPDDPATLPLNRRQQQQARLLASLSEPADQYRPEAK